VLFSILKDNPIRLTELTNMLFEDDGINNFVDFEKKQLVIRIHKNKKGIRYIKLSDETIDDIKKSQKYIKSKYLFCKKRQGDDKDISQDVYGMEELLRVAMKEYNKVHGIEHVKGKFGVHGLRHNKVSKTYKELNVNIDAIKQILALCDSLGNGVSTQARDYLKTIVS
jgi:integrase